ncbi:MAG: DUF4091 domain-containing protein [Candidatus Hydrogenedentes bacterium]|nr:DUF4091 domain-containing protein [Candidatus Hydrogenedentota bacterium]
MAIVRIKRILLPFIFVFSTLILGEKVYPELITNPVEIKNNFIWLKINPENEGVITELGLISPPDNISGPLGMFQEGFGVGSFYVPNRKINEKWELIPRNDNIKELRYTYDCEGPNIQGLSVTRTILVYPQEAGITVRLKVMNKGSESQWIAPWVANSINPGGKWTESDRLEIPTTDGIIRVTQSGHYLASRNWASYTDPELLTNVCLIFHAEQIHSFLAVWEPQENKQGVQTWFTPMVLKPGDEWNTIYKLSIMRGLSHLDFASEEISAQLEYNNTDGKMTLLLSPNRSLNNMYIKARVLGDDGTVWRLPTKKFSFEPNILIRCTYDWKAPKEGRYDFLAKIEQENKTFYLGKETGSPHGGIDTQFIVGNSYSTVNNEDTFPPWTDAPYSLDKKGRSLNKALFINNKLIKGWLENSIFKIYPEDNPEPVFNNAESFSGLVLARGERESFQVALRNNSDEMLHAQLTILRIKGSSNGILFPSESISTYEVKFHRVKIPSYYEGPTGYWPDSLYPTNRIKIPPKSTGAFWVTAHAPEDIPPGEYTCQMEITTNLSDPIELETKVKVLEFAIPKTPYLKTDFGFSWETAIRGARYLTGKDPDTNRIATAYLINAIEHRVTLRELCQFPLPQTPEYEKELENLLPKIQKLQKVGVNLFSVPSKIIEQPDKLTKLHNFLLQHNLTQYTFSQIWEYPKETDVDSILSLTSKWKEIAPNIPLMLTTRGIYPVLPEKVDIWCIHSPIIDTPYNQILLEQIQKGKEVWWCVDHSPPRPYANFFIDFAGIEHRILFWQMWMLGIKGMHYWCVNYTKERNPTICPLDVIPTNGDGYLIYPGEDGPVNSIRWEIIRDGIDDYDYLTIFSKLLKELKQKIPNSDIVKKADSIYDFKQIVPNLVNFTRNSELLLKKREEVALCIEEMLKTIQELRKAPQAQTQNIPPAPTAPSSLDSSPKEKKMEKDKNVEIQIMPTQTTPTEFKPNPKSVGFRRKTGK